MDDTHATDAASERRRAPRTAAPDFQVELAGRLVRARDFSLSGYSVPLAAMPGTEGDLVIGNLVDALGRRATFASEITRIDRGRNLAAASFVGRPVQVEAMLRREIGKRDPVG